ncbi:hypothetical protein Dimus_035787 [Dionaea muscipula]
MRIFNQIWKLQAMVSLTMADNLHEQSLGFLEARGCEVMQGPPVGSVVLSDGDGSEMLVTDLSETRVMAVVSSGVPARRCADGEEVQEIDAGPDGALLPPCSLVSAPSSPQRDELLVADEEVRGCAAVKGPAPAVSAISDASGGQALGDRLTGLNIGGVTTNLTADSDGINSVNPVEPYSDSDGINLAPLLSIIDSSLNEDGMVSEEGLAPMATRAAMRPSPTDGRRQPPMSPVEPARPRTTPPVQPVMTESTRDGLQTPAMGTRTGGVGRLAATETDHQGWQGISSPEFAWPCCAVGCEFQDGGLSARMDLRARGCSSSSLLVCMLLAVAIAVRFSTMSPRQVGSPSLPVGGVCQRGQFSWWWMMMLLAWLSCSDVGSSFGSSFFRCLMWVPELGWCSSPCRC